MRETVLRLIFAVILIPIGAYGSWDTLRSWYNCTGTAVAQVDPRVVKRGSNYSVTYRFAVGGQPFSGVDVQTTVPGETVVVHYDPANPSRNRIGSPDLAATVIAPLLLVGGLVAAATLGSSISSGKARSAMPRLPYPSPGQSSAGWGPSATLARITERHRRINAPGNASVLLCFPTYHGALVYAIQTEHRFSLPPAQARELLWELHRFNLTWGLTAAGAFLIPIISYWNYIRQKRSILQQEQRLTQG
jgi:hypothetical protein